MTVNREKIIQNYNVILLSALKNCILRPKQTFGQTSKLSSNYTKLQYNTTLGS